MRLRYVFLPGIGNSEPEHWQSIWARQLEPSLWVEQADWHCPERDSWLRALVAQVGALAGDKLVIAHSLGCLLAAEASDRLAALGVVGAFLVAPPDPMAPCFPKSVRGFHPPRELGLSVASQVVASEDDRYGSLEYAGELARSWGSRLVNVGARGHINLESRLGEWSEGRALLESFAASLERSA
jgi:predicted alpha/beta hydrolase family esterase